MRYLNYLIEYNIYFIDYSGHIDMIEGLKRIDTLVKYFTDHFKIGDVIKVLMDSKGYIKEDPETHDVLAKIARTKFAEEMNHINIFMAVLNDYYNYSVSENEHWFIIKEDAINWLLEQPA